MAASLSRPVSRTTPSMCSVCNCLHAVPVQLAPREHLNFQWLAWQDAAEKVFSPSNRAAILELSAARTQESSMSENIISIPLRPSRLLDSRSVGEDSARTRVQEEKAELIARIKRMLKEQDAVLVAHYYVHPDLQDLAEATGGIVSDSLDMANFGHQHPAKTIVVAGVRFMGETAKILNPEKRVLMPDLEAECSLDLGCPADEFAAFCDAHPDRTVVVYANTSAAVKARADWMVTSSIALPIVKHLHGARREDTVGAGPPSRRLHPGTDRRGHAAVAGLVRRA